MLNRFNKKLGQPTHGLVSLMMEMQIEPFSSIALEKISGDKILGLIARHAMEKKQLNGNGFVATIHSNSGLGASSRIWD